MQDQINNTENFDCIIFGGTGDLVKRKLLPALYNCMEKENFQKKSRIIGVSKVKMTTDLYREFIHQELKKYLKNDQYNPLKAKKFLSFIFYISLDIENNHGWTDLKKIIESNNKSTRIFYLAVSSIFYGIIAHKINEYQIITSRTRIVIEKPIGNSQISAKKINKTIGNIFKENQIFRIDHYLGKETVQGLISLRFANMVYEPIWNSNYIDHIQITTAENIGIENRKDYYDATGALRDMIQNHILQIMCIIAMEPPISCTDVESIRNEKIKILKSLELITKENIQLSTVRGQYVAGIINGLNVKGYLEEISQDISDTETFVAIKAKIANKRWSNVPFYLRTGKRLIKYVSEIIISFKPAINSIYDNNLSNIDDNKLIIRLQPNGSIKKLLITKDHATNKLKIKKTALDICYNKDCIIYSDGYERLIMDIIINNQTLFMGYNEVDEAWKWTDSILKNWENTGQKVENYIAGTWGPKRSKELIKKDGRKWYEDTLGDF
ncbi:glucose-6-phosphate dehydrogenase [Candidatus Liberibacter americanus]|uniref:Glucose-6-phosphate 1-dehydrogenase n=1 Tax=Candidatus Liberibacter americanus str. Sao Paulo TaxID=1261131 RepID=U6B7E1_9HYPH|nr:glucose-6-phosphate dehydrogenase [Candidatus Liberibacter americanus]AHA27771.1 Glucose-6-phosphate 1-dehydrogenase [Candidatus Liberibacter americanus str. Sao Paulo]EMS36156.1 glucose-6-phosphate 1-dehydrogenase [Candidatus Liberibacter americanus PW_SP]